MTTAGAEPPVAIVTGGASGIGAATVRLLGTKGCAIAVFDLDTNGALAVLAEVDAGGQRSLACSLDISDWDAVDAAVQRVVDHLGPVTYLVNGAASFNAAGKNASRADWERSLSVNVAGSARVTATVAEHMPRGAAVVNVASISAYVAQPDRWTYNTTKAAIVGLTRCQALDLAPQGIRVNSVSPGWIWTPEVARAAGNDRAQWEPVWGRFHMLGRLGEATEVAEAIWFLLSPQASFITATDLAVDGGYLGMSAEGTGAESTFAGTN